VGHKWVVYHSFLLGTQLKSNLDALGLVLRESNLPDSCSQRLNALWQWSQLLKTLKKSNEQNLFFTLLPLNSLVFSLTLYLSDLWNMYVKILRLITTDLHGVNKLWLAIIKIYKHMQ
jgi:hypothetical protein